MILKSIFFMDIYFKWHRHSYSFETLAFLLVVILCNFLPLFPLYKALFRLCKR
jgi:hypothetical protein